MSRYAPTFLPTVYLDREPVLAWIYYSRWTGFYVVDTAKGRFAGKLDDFHSDGGMDDVVLVMRANGMA